MRDDKVADAHGPAWQVDLDALTARVEALEEQHTERPGGGFYELVKHLAQPIERE